MRVPMASYVLAAGLIFTAASQAAGATTAPAPCAAPHDPRVEGVVVEQPPAATTAAPPALPAPLDEAGARLFDAEAYRDVFGILRGENPCSRFFGGPAASLEVFNAFARRLETKPLESESIILRMEGAYANYQNMRTGAAYRIFERASLNSDGPFFRRRGAARSARLRVGQFGAGTRQARALVLLHELGHLVEGGDGRWLLPNDGDDAGRSDRNTRKVQDQCLEQILALKP